MKQLLHGQFAPVTDRIGFFSVPVEQIVSAHREWLTERGRLTMAFDELNCDLATALRRLEPLNLVSSLLVATASSWVAILNGAGDPSSAVCYLSSRAPIKGLIVDCIQDTYDRKTGGGRPGGVQFQFCEGPAPSSVHVVRRVISATNQCEHWEWYEEGERLPFEEPQHYTARRIRDRLTPEMVEHYCLALGIRLFDEGFYGPRCILIHDTREPPSDFRPDTYETVQKRLGIR